MFAACVIFAVFSLSMNGARNPSVTPVTLWFGAISYSPYTTHRNLGYATLHLLDRLGIPEAVALATTFACAMLLATALHYVVERPAEQTLKAWHRNRAATLERTTT